MKKLLFSVLIFTLITSPASASEVIDVFEEYASSDDFVCKTYSFSIDTLKNEDTKITFFTQCSAPYSVFVTSSPENGTVSINENEFVYTPVENFTGSDSFQYRIYANGVYSNISECNINVTGEEIKDTTFHYEDLQNHPLKKAAEKLVEMNILKGERIADKYYFHPNSQLTRGLAISYICAALGANTNEKNIPVIFSDENTLSQQQKNDAYNCYSAGIITGKQIEDKIYLCANEPLTRSEMFSMIDRAFSGKSHSETVLDFPDTKSIPDYAKLNVKNLVENGFIKNSKTELLRPNDTATKIEFAELLYKLVLSNEESVTKTLSQRIKEGFYANLIT